MKHDIPRIPRAARVCPGCGYEIPQILVDRARFDFPCPRCEKHTLREFLPIRREDAMKGFTPLGG